MAHPDFTNAGIKWEWHGRFPMLAFFWGCSGRYSAAQRFAIGADCSSLCAGGEPPDRFLHILSILRRWVTMNGNSKADGAMRC